MFQILSKQLTTKKKTNQLSAAIKVSIKNNTTQITNFLQRNMISSNSNIINVIQTCGFAKTVQHVI